MDSISWKREMRDFVETVYERIPATFPRYKLAKSDFHTSSTGDEAYLRSETSRLFEWLALTRLDPQAEVRELRQMTQYRPDTFFILQHLATLILYLFHFDHRILSNTHFGEAPIERLISLFLKEPSRFSPNGRSLLPPIETPPIVKLAEHCSTGLDKTQNSSETTALAGLQIDAVVGEPIVTSTAIIADTTPLISENIQIASEAPVSSFNVKHQSSGLELENKFDGFEGTTERIDIIGPATGYTVETSLDKNSKCQHAETNSDFE